MRRSAKAAAEACDKVRQAFEILGDDVPDNLKSAGQLRLDHADASLEQLGRLADPPITKDAIAGRIRRLLQLAEKTEKARRQAACIFVSGNKTPCDFSVVWCFLFVWACIMRKWQYGHSTLTSG